jgi:hypothetical protein
MAKDLTKRTGPKAPKQAEDVASRLKAELMQDTLARMFGEEAEKAAAPGPPRAILALAAFAPAGWDRAKGLQRKLFEAAAGNLEMKFACYGPDDSKGVRHARITKRWIGNSGDMAGLIDKAECVCGCFINIHDVLAQAVKEAEERSLRAVIIVADAFHDTLDDLNEAAISAIQLRRAGTQVFLLQLGDALDTARKLQHLARLSGAAYLSFGPKQERQFAEMWEAVSVYTAGGEEAVKAKGGQAATLLLQQFKQEPLSMPIVEERARARVKP